MNNALKTGDIAMITGTKNDRLNGLAVELIALIGDVYDTVSAGNTTWSVSRNSKNRQSLWHVKMLNMLAVDRKGNAFSEIPVPEKYLMPLRGDFAAEQRKVAELAL